VSKSNKDWDKLDFYANPTQYDCTFSRFLAHTDILITGHYWDHRAQVFFTNEDIAKADFRPLIIADITCDIQ
jgi:hypothetical protein